MEPPHLVALPQIAFVRARHYLAVSRVRTHLIVLHCMEAPEKSNRAEGCARYFATLPPDKPASAHFCVDDDSIVQCVHVEHVAYHAPGANHHGIGIEHAGYARQTRDEWLDDFGRRMLALSGRLTAHLCQRFEIPVAYVTAEELVDTERGVSGGRGITTHAEVSRAFKRSTHTDPGPSFPIDDYLAFVWAAL